MNKYAIFGILVAALLATGGGTFLAYGHFLGGPSGHSKEAQKASNSSEDSNYSLVVMGWTTSNGPDPGANAFGDVSSLIVLMLEQGNGGIVYRPINVSALTPKELKSMGIIICPGFEWGYAGNTYVGNLSHIPPGNPPITHVYFYNPLYQKVEVFFPEWLKVTPGKPFGVIILNFNFKTAKKCPPPLKNISFKFSFKEISKQQCEVWISIYANGTYIGKVPVLLKVVPPGVILQKNQNRMRAQEIYKLNYKASLLKTYSWPAYNPMINNSEVRESLLVMVLYNGSLIPSKVSYNIKEMGIYATPGYGWGYCKSPKMGNSTFLSKEYQKVVVYYPKELKVTPGKAFGIILRYLHLPTGKGMPKPLGKLTFHYSLQKVSGKEYELYVSIYANGTYLGKIQITLELKP